VSRTSPRKIANGGAGCGASVDQCGFFLAAPSGGAGEVFADAATLVERYAPGFTASVIDRQILSPVDLESTFNLTGGNIFQGSMGLHQLFAFRPVPGFAGYRTPVKGLYVCGAAAHPGGGVMGAAGWNAAREMLKR